MWRVFLTRFEFIIFAQVLLKVIRAKNKFIRKAAAAREQLNNENRQSGNLEILNP